MPLALGGCVDLFGASRGGGGGSDYDCGQHLVATTSSALLQVRNDVSHKDLVS